MKSSRLQSHLRVAGDEHFAGNGVLVNLNLGAALRLHRIERLSASPDDLPHVNLGHLERLLARKTSRGLQYIVQQIGEA